MLVLVPRAIWYGKEPLVYIKLSKKQIQYGIVRLSFSSFDEQLLVTSKPACRKQQ